MAIIPVGSTRLFAWVGAQINLAGSALDVPGCVVLAITDENASISWRSGRAASLNSLTMLETNRCYYATTSTASVDLPDASVVIMGNTVSSPANFRGKNLGNLQVELTWLPPVSAIKFYEIQIGLNAQSFGASIRVTSETLTATVAAEGTYTARIRARTDLGIGPWGNIIASVSVTIAVPPPPPAPVITFISGIPSDSNFVNFQDAGGVPNDPSAASSNAAVWNSLCATLRESTWIFPAGTWFFNDTLMTVNPTTNRWFARTIIRGDSEGTTTIRLIDDAPGFNNPSTPKRFLILGGSENQWRINPPQGQTANPNGAGNTSFGMRLINLTIDTGNNPGVNALDFDAHNWGSVQNVTIRGVGVNGYDAHRPTGPYLVKNLTVDGFRVGIFQGQEIYSQTYLNITLLNQSQVGILNNGNTMSIENLNTNLDVPAINNNGSRGLVTLINSSLSSPAGNGPAIINNGTLYLKNVSTPGYANAVDLGGGRVIPGPSISEYSTGVYKIFPSPPGSLKLPAPPTPAPFTSTNLSDWVNVAADPYNVVSGNRFSTTAQPNQLSKLDVAAASGKPILYFPSQVAGTNQSFTTIIGNTWVIPPSVRKIVFNSSVLAFGSGAWPSTSAPVLRTSGSTTNSLHLDMGFVLPSSSMGATRPLFSIVHDSPRPLILTGWRLDIPITALPGAGPIYVEDLLIGYGNQNRFLPGIHAQPGTSWCIRSLNTEYRAGLLNDAANVFILGHKTEGAWEIIRTINGGKTESLGLYIFQNESAASALADQNRVLSTMPAITCIDSQFSGVVANDAPQDANRYTVIMNETRAGVTRTFNPGMVRGHKISVLSAYPHPVAPTDEPVTEDMQYMGLATKAPILTAQRSAYNEYIAGLRADGLLPKILYIFPVGGGNLETALKGWDFRFPTPLLRDMSPFSVPESAYSIRSGIQGDVNGRGIVTGFAPNSVSADSIGLHFWTAQAETGSGVRTLMGGVVNSGGDRFTALGKPNSGNLDGGTIGGNMFTTSDLARVSSGYLLGMISVVNNSSRISQLYNNGNPLGIPSNVQSAALNNSMGLLCTFRTAATQAPLYSTSRNMLWGAITTGLTQTEMGLFYVRTLKLMQDTGRWPTVISSPAVPALRNFSSFGVTTQLTPSPYANTVTGDLRLAMVNTGVAPLTAELLSFDSMVTALINASLWSKIYALYPFMGENANHAIRFVNRTTGVDAIGVCTGDTTGYSKALGFQGNGARAIGGGIDPRNFLNANNAGLHAWTSQNESGSGNRYLMGFWDSTQTHYMALGKLSGNEGGVVAGTLAQRAIGPSNSTGLISVISGAARTAQMYVAGTASGAAGPASTGIIEAGMHILSGFRRGSAPDGWTSRNVGFAAVTQAFTASEMTDFNNAVTTFLTAIGRTL